MTREQKEIFQEADISSALKKQIRKYLKDAKRSMSCPKEEKDFYISNLLKGILVYIEENPGATMNDIRLEIGATTAVEENLFDTLVTEKPEKVKNRMTFHRVLVIAAILIVTIIGLVYASALIESHFIATGSGEEVIQDIEEEIVEFDGGN